MIWQYVSIDEVKDPKKHAMAMGPFGSNITIDNFVEKGIPVIRGGNLKNNQLNEDTFVFVTEEKANELIASNAYPEDIVFTHRGTLGQVIIIPKNSKYKRYVVSQSQMKLTCDKSKVSPLFVYYYFCSPQGQHEMYSYTNSTGVPSISSPLSSLKAMKIPHIPLQEQEKIGKILIDLDDKIKNLQNQNDILQQIIYAIFKSWFIDFDGVSKFNDSELGSIPKGWKIELLGDLFTVTDYTANGSFAGLNENVTYSYVPDYAILVRQIDYNNNWNGNYVYVDKHSYNFLKKSSLESGDVMVSNIGNVGIVFRVPNLGKPMTGAPNVLIIKTSKFKKEFVYQFLKSSIGQNEMFSIVSGSAQPKFNKTDFRHLKIISPLEEIIKQFDNVTNPLQRKRENNSIQMENLHKIKNILLPKLMLGEIKV